MSSTMQEFNKIKELLKSKIKISVEWDGRVPTDLEGAYDVAAEHSYTYPLNDVENAVRECINRAESPDEREQYSELEKSVYKISKHVDKLAENIHKRAQRLGESSASIPDSYFENTARKFVNQNKKECVVVAPDLWLPNCIKK